ncbi:flagellar assembly protein FliW [Bacillus carboniphilus]|uniref:Flagellar assembly factor FliW n=2 Tax=Bacillus carboniphilus TaxID=86663 RepID=A0ABN0VW29_9BACI
MKLVTKYHGKIEIEQSEVIHFPKGIPAFEEEQEFILLQLTDEKIYYILQSVKTPDLGFVVTDPFLFFKDYDFQLDESTVKALDLKSPTDVKILTIVSVRDPFSNSTANLQAPIVINANKNRAKQVVLNVENYHTKHRLFNEIPVGSEG